MNWTDDRLYCILSFVGPRAKEHHLVILEFPEDILKVTLDCGPLTVGTGNSRVRHLVHYTYFLVFPKLSEKIS